MTKFSIIIPAYNVQDFLPACLDSVLSQDFKDYEIVLVDDGSTDNTGKICDEYQKSRAKHDKNTTNPPSPTIVAQIDQNVNAKIQVIHQVNSGLSEARNSGVKVASGEYLIFLDGDDSLTPGALSKIATALAKFTEPVDLLRFQCQDLLESGKPIPHPEPGFSPMFGLAAFPLLARCHYTENAWLYCYRTDFFRSNHFTYAKGRLAEDFGLTPLIIARAASVAAISDICYNYRLRPGSIMRDPTKLYRRVADAMKGLEYQLPLLDKIDRGSTAPISHYLCVSFLTLASTLPTPEFLQFYRKFTAAGFKKYIKPQSLRSLPRAVLLRHFPRLYRLLLRPKD